MVRIIANDEHLASYRVIKHNYIHRALHSHKRGILLWMVVLRSRYNKPLFTRQFPCFCLFCYINWIATRYKGGDVGTWMPILDGQLQLFLRLTSERRI